MSASTKKVRVHESSSVTFLERKAFKFTWTIKDFSTWQADKEGFHESALFPSGKRESIQWVLEFQPKSEFNEFRCALYLALRKCPGNHLDAEFNFTLLDSNQDAFLVTSYYKKRFMNGVTAGTGNGHLIRIDNLLDKTKKDNVLIITCEILAKIRFVDEIIQPTNTINQLEPPSSIADDFATLIDGQRFGDATVKVGGKKFRVYKGILASRSPVFAAMFEHKMQEKIKNVVTIFDVEPTVFHEMLRYIYTDKVQNLTALAFQLYAAANKYGIRTLKTLCRMSILGNLSKNNATEAIKCAHLHQDSEMKRYTMEFLYNNADNLLAMTESAGWKELEQTFPHLVIEVLKAIVKPT